MEQIQSYFLEALKASLEDKKVSWESDISKEEWITLFKMAEIHHVLPMIFDAVYDCESAKKMDPAFFMTFKQRMKKIVLMQILKTSEFLNLNAYLRKQNVTPVMVKGIICRELYPHPDYRISGDEDMLIDATDFNVYHRFMTSFGMEVADEKADIENDFEIPYRKKGSPIYIELHKHLFPPQSKAYGELNQFFEDVHENAIDMMVQNQPVRTMEYTMHLFYLIAHAFKHFLHSGFGIRQVCDIIMFANAYGDKIDWEKLKKQTDVINATKFSAALFKMGELYLHFNCPSYPAIWKNIQVDEKPLLEDLLQSGVYGNSDMSRKHSSNITLNAVASSKAGKEVKGSVLKTIFPSKEALVGRYTFLKKYPWLLPYAWLDRILKYRKEMKTTSSNSATESIKIGNERIALMKEYDIINK